MADRNYPNDVQGGIDPYSPFVVEERQTQGGGRMSLRGYTFALTALVFAGFLVMGICASLYSNVGFYLWVVDHYLMFSLVSFALSIAGIVMMVRAKTKESVGLSLAGYAVFVLSFGFSTSMILLYYNAQTISTAFLATAGITVTFACLGLVFPKFFQKVQGVLMAGLFGIILVEVVMILFGVDQTWTDFIVIALFCGFIGYDFHKAMYDEPTLVNAVYNASELFLDIINIFLRILDIFGRRD